MESERLLFQENVRKTSEEKNLTLLKSVAEKETLILNYVSQLKQMKSKMQAAPVVITPSKINLNPSIFQSLQTFELESDTCTSTIYDLSVIIDSLTVEKRLDRKKYEELKKNSVQMREFIIQSSLEKTQREESQQLLSHSNTLANFNMGTVQASICESSSQNDRKSNKSDERGDINEMAISIAALEKEREGLKLQLVAFHANEIQMLSKVEMRSNELLSANQRNVGLETTCRTLTLQVDKVQVQTTQSHKALFEYRALTKTFQSQVVLLEGEKRAMEKDYIVLYEKLQDTKDAFQKVFSTDIPKLLEQNRIVTSASMIQAESIMALKAQKLQSDNLVQLSLQNTQALTEKVMRLKAEKVWLGGDRDALQAQLEALTLKNEAEKKFFGVKLKELSISLNARQIAA